MMTNMLRTTLLGFDARTLSPKFDALWDRERRRKYLIRNDVERPLSTDTLVWPSLFDTGQGATLSSAKGRQLGLEGYPCPSHVTQNLGLWKDQTELLTYISGMAGINDQHYTVISISLVLLEHRNLAGREGLGAASFPPVVDSEWKLLGFDVSDQGLISGLSNCELSRNDHHYLSIQWGKELNRWHLFPDPLVAGRFAETMDDLVPEHAPFQVWAIHLVESTLVLQPH